MNDLELCREQRLHRLENQQYDHVFDEEMEDKPDQLLFINEDGYFTNEEIKENVDMYR